MKTPLRGLRRWVLDNLATLLTALVASLLALVIFLLTADLEVASARVRAFREWANPFVEAATFVIGLIVGAVVSYSATNFFLRLLRWSLRRVRHKITQLVDRHYLGVIRLLLASHEERLSLIERSLGIGNHARLNLPDNMTPEMIERAVRAYERRRGLSDGLWPAVERSIRNTRNGYMVLGREGNTSRGSHHADRQSAEARLAERSERTAVLVHVIADDW